MFYLPRDSEPTTLAVGICRAGLLICAYCDTLSTVDKAHTAVPPRWPEARML